MKLSALTTEEARAFVAQPHATVLVPTGSVEPHGPHLPLGTDTTISEEACRRAIPLLAKVGVPALVAPSIPYGVTDYASGFTGAIGVPDEVLSAFLRALAERLLADGVAHVCFVNNHLEPAHDSAVRAAAAALPAGRGSAACPLTRKWGRTLSDEFKRGACHAGRYETSLVLAAREDGASSAEVRDLYRGLPPLTMSLSDGIREGQRTFAEMGLTRAYTGAPAEATAAEGRDLYERLTAMVVGEVTAALGLTSPVSP